MALIYLFANEAYGLPFIRAARIESRRLGVRARLVLSTRPAPEAPAAAAAWGLRTRRRLAARMRHGLPVLLVEDVNAPPFLAQVRSGDHGIVAGFNQIFRRETIARFATLANFHPSLLPYYRGPVPSHWCLKHGETATGFTLHRVTPRIDSGQVLWQEQLEVGAARTAAELDRRIAERAARLMGPYLEHVCHGAPLAVRRVDAATVYRHHPDYLSLTVGNEALAKELKNLLIHRLLEPKMLRAARRHFHGRLVDIGCGTKPYQTVLEGCVAEHVGVDHAASPHGLTRVDLVGTAYAIPAAEASFDCALSTAVLEHLEEPAQALLECARVLKPGAVAIYTAPFIWHLHEEPRDFFRFTKYGLRHLFEKSGFEIVEIEALSGFWATFGQLLVYNIYRCNRGPLKLVVPPIGLAIQGIALVLDRIDRTKQWTWMYLVVARKR